MSERGAERLQWGLILAMAAAAAYALVQLPPGARVPTHFTAQMQADGWSDAAIGLWLLPALALALRGLQALLPRPGFGLVVLGLMLPVEGYGPAVLLLSLLPGLAATGYSWWLWRSLPR